MSLQQEPQENYLTRILDAEFLRQLVRAIVQETMVQVKDLNDTNGQWIFSEEEAADILRLEPHQLRRIRYLHSDIMDYMLSRRTGAADQPAIARPR